jgi:hypothetical protein
LISASAAVQSSEMFVTNIAPNLTVSDWNWELKLRQFDANHRGAKGECDVIVRQRRLFEHREDAIKRARVRRVVE